MGIDAKHFLFLARGLGLKLHGENRRIEKFDGEIAFKATFGVKPQAVAAVYTFGRMKKNKVSPKHLLWGLFHLKLYLKETVSAAVFGATRKMYRKHVKAAVMAVSLVFPDVVS